VFAIYQVHLYNSLLGIYKSGLSIARRAIPCYWL